MIERNLADIFETVADALPDLELIVQGPRRVTWSQVDVRADALAQTLVEHGLQRQDKVALFLFNCPEYLETCFAAFKASLVPVNTNYRYRGEELIHLWRDADAAVVVFHASLAGLVEEVRAAVPGVRLWVCVDDDGAHSLPDWAVAYDAAAAPRRTRLQVTWARTPDDLVIVYTGGTTGAPKGVMWRQADVFKFVNGHGASTHSERFLPWDATQEEIKSLLHRRPRWVHLPPVPMMHLSGGWSSYGTMSSGGRIVLLAGRRYDAAEMLDLVDQEGVQRINLVGEAFARPLLDALRTNPGRWRLSSLELVSSTGAALSTETLTGLLGLLPERVAFAEGLGSTEALAMGTSTARRGDAREAGRFMLGADTRVLTADGRDVTPGSAEVGQLHFGGLQPLGYYKDPEKTARTFPEIDGKRYVASGDFATVAIDGTLSFVGRGNVCINTGGEKVYPEEVERALSRHPGVVAAAVIGVPDERFGQSVCALVSRRNDVTAEDLRDFLAPALAGYKLPRRIEFVTELPRHANGKLDYASIRRLVELQPSPFPS